MANEDEGDLAAGQIQQSSWWSRSSGASTPGVFQGIAFESSTGHSLPDGAKRSPDASWVHRSRLAALPPEQKKKFLSLCPDFVVELRSPADSLAGMQAKREEYRGNGARLGWLIGAAERRMRVYQPGVAPDALDAPASTSAGPKLAGFALDLARVWEPGF